MKIEAKIFEILTVFFLIVGIVYALFTGLSRTGVEWAGVTAIALSVGLTLIIGTYFRFVARRLDTRPEDFDDAEVSDGAGDLGFFSPGSFWPILIAASGGVIAVGFAFLLWWIVGLGVALVLISAAGLVFEYHLGPEKH